MKTEITKCKSKCKSRSVSKPIDCYEKVRELAYLKWEAAGKPLSDGLEFWIAAEEEVLKQE